MNRSLANICWPMLLACIAACGGGREEASRDEAGLEQARGPHGGRILGDDGLRVELAIFEEGVPPEFRLYATDAGKPVPAADLKATVQLHRVTGLPGGRTEQYALVPRGEHLASTDEVYEPHSFDVTLAVTYAGRALEWSWHAPEGRIAMASGMAQAAGVVTAPAGPGSIADVLRLYGRVVPDAERVRAVRARFPGPVRSVAVRIGDTVRAGQQLATVESNESLQVYTVSAPLAGVVTARNVNPGENAGDEPLFEIVDYSTVWAELPVFPRDRARLAVGQKAEIGAAESAQQASGKIRTLAPAGAGSTALTARVQLDNRERQWTPGQFVEARISMAEHAAAVVVPITALQRFRDWDVVYVNDGEVYQALPVRVGRRDSRHAEILSGLSPGAQVVVTNSYLIKADVEKSGASHDH